MRCRKKLTQSGKMQTEMHHDPLLALTTSNKSLVWETRVQIQHKILIIINIHYWLWRFFVYINLWLVVDHFTLPGH